MTTNRQSDLDQPAQYLKGVGPKKAELLQKLGARTVGDLLFHFPLRYEDRSNIKKISRIEVGEVAVVRAVVKSAGAAPRRRRGRIFEVAFADGTGVLRATWFAFSEKAMLKKFQPGSEWIVSGKVTFNRYRGSKTMAHPDTEEVSEGAEGESLHVGRITPVYPLTEGLNQKAMRRIVHSALDHAGSLEDFVPEELNVRYKLPPLAVSVRYVHWPPEGAPIGDLMAFRAREQKKLIFNEFFIAQTGLALKRRAKKVKVEGAAMNVDGALLDKIRDVLPFRLTGAQERALNEIAADMGRDEPMSRLLQGDVGSGKTAIALAACLVAVRNRRQAAIMAPTEILAVQHFRNVSRLLTDTKVRIELLTSGAKDKKRIYEELKAGDIHIAVGTHALIQEGVEFHDLGLAVVDEQHRFGVVQRKELIAKGRTPHSLIMTATPIPRTLAMTLYGDLDVSVIDELPPGRAPVTTKIYGPANRRTAINLIRDEVGRGRQAYVVYPLVEESEKLELKAATTMFEHFANEDFADLRLGLTHGRMKSAEKDEVMTRFAQGEIDVLVSTTVIEVGVDNPNATVMMIEHADRFGLSQLHQLRGRVGRGAAKSHCLLMADTPPGTPTWERLRVMEKSSDGFVIAEADLAQRGAGDFFGQRQWGLPEFRIGDILRDHRILAEARRAAFAIVGADPRLEKPENAPLRRALKEKWKHRFELGDIG